MQTRSLAAWASFAGQVAAGAAAVIWPEDRWIAEVIFAASVAGFVIVSLWWFFANFRFAVPVVRRRPNIRKTLQNYYVSGEILQMRRVTTDEEFSKYKVDMARWLFPLMNWIEENMSEAALTRFQDLRNVLPIIQSHEFNEEHRKHINTISKYRDNLRSFIESDAWDK